MKKPSFKNSYFKGSAILIWATYLILVTGHFFLAIYYGDVWATFKSRDLAWDVAEMLSLVTFLTIIVSTITRIAFLCMKKINLAEYLICLPMNLMAILLCFNLALVMAI